MLTKVGFLMKNLQKSIKAYKQTQLFGFIY